LSGYDQSGCLRGREKPDSMICDKICQTIKSPRPFVTPSDERGTSTAFSVCGGLRLLLLVHERNRILNEAGIRLARYSVEEDLVHLD